ncbi:N-acetylglucosamine/diacetylchitobiose ABC transporter substrate-binding protein [Crossiella cryophila]|uniref:N-acetylglucosamine transport system substrate-binding protein n=1 Tax=Crossiella cryophila TaxID=43355 RepID=A0A7W7CEE7_9PSEU|nr:N-acetylglucosamine/diacetylchitobiose ABC transporter substrate-binding protein [Crossiella cryophila]MBB4679648.1 N-acetylglucosamine transport system substrate-binding protein [Crossiella cryophila]
MTRTNISRRDLLRAAAVLGMSAPLLGACVTGGGPGAGPGQRGERSAGNPFGVKAGSPLEVVVFKGGYGDDYVKAAEEVYRRQHQGSAIEHRGIQQVGDTLRPRFVANTPPDVVDNTGAGALDISALAAAGQLTNLAELLDAPSWDDPNVTVRNTLLPGVVEDGERDGVCVHLNYTFTVWGLWYSKSLFDRQGWTYPATWEAMLALCAEIKKTGIAPWTYQGKYPDYVTDPLLTMAAKSGGMDLIRALDNLEPGAWRHEAVRGAAEAFAELAGRGYFMPGSEALSHTEAQAAWCQGKAAFIPSGSWLESEQRDVTPPGFEMTLGVLPARTTADKLKPTALEASSTESYLVPAQAKNIAGGLDFLRMLFSRNACREFARTAGTLPSVAGATDGLTLSSGLGSVSAAVRAAGTELISFRHRGWYPQLRKATDDAVGELITRRLTPAAFADRLQLAADALAKDSSVKKYTRR